MVSPMTRCNTSPAPTRRWWTMVEKRSWLITKARLPTSPNTSNWFSSHVSILQWRRANSSNIRLYTMKSPTMMSFCTKAFVWLLFPIVISVFG